MDLNEYRGKQLFAEHGITIPEGELISDAQSVRVPEAEKVVVKAQVPAGKRAKHGGIEIVDRSNAESAVEAMLGSDVAGYTVDAVLVEEAVDITDELYVSLSINRAGKNVHLVFSEEGGSGIESVADADPDSIHTFDFYTLDRDILQEELAHLDYTDALVEVITDMYALLRAEDALLVEINPLVVTDQGGLVATDAKVRIDDSALYRHEEFGSDDGEELEFVPLDGNIAVIGNGAGLVMATLDSIHHFGGAPADFLDIGGGADVETMHRAMRKAMDQEHVDGMFINIFGGITRCDLVAEGIIDVVEETGMDIPLVVRMVGTNQDEGRAMLEENGIHALNSMDACAERITELAEDDN